jgi:hypothetical protein
MTARYTFIFGCLLVLVGCLAPGDKRFVDHPRHEAYPTVKEITAEGDLLRISVVQDGSPVFVAGIEALLLEGDVYLRPVCISSVVHATEFAVDLSDKRFPRDWRSRLYWIEEDAISSPVNPFIHHYREIHRSKIVIR